MTAAETRYLIGVLFCAAGTEIAVTSLPDDELARAAALVTTGLWLGVGTVFTAMWLLARRRLRRKKQEAAGS